MATRGAGRRRPRATADEVGARARRSTSRARCEQHDPDVHHLGRIGALQAFYDQAGAVDIEARANALADRDGRPAAALAGIGGVARPSSAARSSTCTASTLTTRPSVVVSRWACAVGRGEARCSR